VRERMRERCSLSSQESTDTPLTIHVQVWRMGASQMKAHMALLLAIAACCCAFDARAQTADVEVPDLFSSLGVPEGTRGDIEDVQKVRVVEEPVPGYKNRVSLNPLLALFGLGALTYERQVDDHVALLGSGWHVSLESDGEDFSGYSLQGGLGIFPRGPAPKGVHVRATVGFGSISSGVDKASFYSGGLMVLYNWIWRSGFSLGLGGGFERMKFEDDDHDFELEGTFPALEFSLGFAF
jgi:hypothetical protein